MTARSIALFAAAVAEIGAYLIRIGLREGRRALYVVLGGVAPSTACTPIATT